MACAVGVLPPGEVLLIRDWMADTEVVETGTSTPLPTVHPSPLEVYNLSPQLMEPVVALKVAFMAVVRAVQRVVQFAVSSHTVFRPASAASQ